MIHFVNKCRDMLPGVTPCYDVTECHNMLPGMTPCSDVTECRSMFPGVTSSHGVTKCGNMLPLCDTVCRRRKVSQHAARCCNVGCVTMSRAVLLRAMMCTVHANTSPCDRLVCVTPVSDVFYVHCQCCCLLYISTIWSSLGFMKGECYSIISVVLDVSAMG